MVPEVSGRVEFMACADPIVTRVSAWASSPKSNDKRPASAWRGVDANNNTKATLINREIAKRELNILNSGFIKQTKYRKIPF
ncbi:hypothetical protein A2738_02735 [Candidatus Nomurabacteria bacterium RIFCSPHIGHO2_01_FULL_42_15]|uniref:Uncharacterized protein n=1 Tax=Candidatus Nomurabacteria bacterium RIFCSPHIGHO2_01_FULL_42_15 TaxID=1801742 RepID=A0A1F6VER1_9BACT|nr:MAG: hypothetical protein A2738_02735 [Candidatus Nomurabacteria bacterium RIFCSPHIGHO2_01_FULL_42_15]OGI92786.1 MAG: hypothetical protein A3A99_02800 [Candidatus Nomurabacteria bacterium RIFCSPLOWO2_01_FULL_41_18]